MWQGIVRRIQKTGKGGWLGFLGFFVRAVHRGIASVLKGLGFFLCGLHGDSEMSIEVSITIAFCSVTVVVSGFCAFAPLFKGPEIFGWISQLLTVGASYLLVWVLHTTIG